MAMIAESMNRYATLTTILSGTSIETETILRILGAIGRRPVARVWNEFALGVGDSFGR